jgi:hypothetical protein
MSQGGDLGAVVSNVMAEQAPPELLGIHVNLPATVPPDVAKALQAGDPAASGLSVDERRAYEQLKLLFARRRAYATMMGTRPQRLYGLADSPIGLAAWLLTTVTVMASRRRRSPQPCSGARSMDTPQATLHETTSPTTPPSTG